MKKVYNIYYNNQKINNLPVNEEELKKIYSSKYVYKIINNERKKIDLNNTFIRECIII